MYKQVDPTELHDLCRGGIPSYRDDDMAIVNMREITEEELAGLNESMFFIRVAYDNKGRENGGSHFQRIDLFQAIDKITNKFKGIAELEVWECDFLHDPDWAPRKNRKLPTIHNAFQMRVFIKSIIDKEKLKKLIKEGIGSRKSYGFGLIVFEELL